MMKKILSLLIVLLANITAFAAEKTVWEGNEPISWNTEVAPGTQFATPEGTFTGLAKGDIIRAYTTTTYDAPQYVMTYMKGDSWDWTDLETTLSNGVMTYTVADETIATEIATRWIVFRGQAYTLTKITVETPESGSETTETVIWEGTTALDWAADPGVSVSLEASKFANAKAGDILKIEGTVTNEYTQIQVCVNYPWKSSDSFTILPINFEITADDLENIKANGMTIAGQYATITKVSLVKNVEPEPEPSAGETYTAWTGETVFTSGWSVWEQIPASSFAKAQKDMLLRFRFKNVGAGAQFKVSTSAWADMPDAELVNINGIYQQYTITEAMLAELQANGCIVSGTSFTLISIEVINPADLKPLTLSVPVTGGDWVFENETPTFIIQATNPYDEALTANAVISIATDKIAPVTTLTKEVEIAAGATENIELSWTDPAPTAGFFKATCTVNDDLARAFFFGVNPTQIVSAPDKQTDFDTFWEEARDQLAAIEATDEPVLTEITSKSTEKRKVYLVEFKSIPDGTSGEPVTVRGYYAEPTDGKKHPVIMHYQGYDSGYRPGGQDATPWCFDGDGDELSADYAEFILSTRGQSINNRPASDRADGINRDFENTYGDWIAYNFGNKDQYYYRGAYMDCVRAIDFMATRPTSDMTNLYAEGQSQGGAFTYAAAALSGREFKAIAPGIAFMGDFPDYFEIVNWPAYVARECQQTLGLSDAEMYAFLSYFDTKNLSTLISDKVAVIATIGVQDNVCPPHTNIAPYNNLAAGTVKEISFNPENAHQVAANWYDVYMAYFKSKYVEPQPEPEPATPVFDENGIADLSKIEVQDADKVTYDVETHTVTTTEGWTGVQLTVTDGEEVSGKELRITFDREMAVKCYVKYMDETDADVIMDKAEKILYFTLDETKKLYQVQIQPTDASTFAFEEIKVNQESTRPEPAPATPVFDENGKADLSKMEVQDADKVTYDVETHTVTTTEGWTGVQLTVTDGEEVSGKELRITFDREMSVKCYVKYLDETDADVIMDKAEKILYFTLDETKKLYQVQIQPTDASTFAFEEIKVNQESTRPEPEPEPEEKTENAQKLMDVLQTLYGNKIISGTTAYVDWNTKQAEQVNEWTGKYPAMNTYDFLNIHASKDVNPEGWLDYSDISGVKKWASEGGLVSAMWHWQVKNNAGTGYTCTPGTADAETSFDASKILIEGTAENTLAKQQLSQVCGYLKKMKDAGIPVIWRPFHEAAGNTTLYSGGTAWFWWGAQGADVYKHLWQWMYNYMVNERGLNNLIWVWTSQTKDGDWYPGNSYVDIIGRDIYGGQAAKQKSDFDNLTASYPNMMIALSECGNINDANQSDISTVWETSAKWSWFSTWYDAAGNQLHNTQDWWKNAFSQDYVITRAQMKELLDLNIEPDPEPQPDPTTNTFDENGVADLSKIEVQNADKVTYNATTHTVTTTEGWTGVQLTVAEGEQVSGKELRVTFDRAMRVKCYIKYMDETDTDIIMDDAAEILYFELDNTKKLYQVHIQPTEAATFAFNEIRVNAESTKPLLKPLEEGEVRTLFEDEQGVVMAWNEICQMDVEWGAILETGESFLITVKSRTMGSEWPKVILRDANSESVVEVGLSEVSGYPYIVKILLTDDIVTKLRNGFRFSGDGIVITKIELSKPAPAKEGDVNIEALNWFRNAIYDAAVYTGSTSSRWGQFGWQIGDERYADKTLVIVCIKETTFPVTLKMEYTNTDGKAMATSMGVAPGKTQLNLSLPLDTKVIKKIYLTYSEAGSVVLTDVAVIAGANARPLTGYEDDSTTGVEEAIVNALSRTHATSIYYDLLGRKFNGQLKKGLYIKDGKKIVIK